MEENSIQSVSAEVVKNKVVLKAAFDSRLPEE